MAEALEGPSPDGVEPRVHHSDMDVSNGKAGTFDPHVDVVAGTLAAPTAATGVGRFDEESPIPPIGLHTSRMKTLRKSHGELRQVHSVSHQTQVGSTKQWLGGHWARNIGKIFFAAALTFKHIAGFAEIHGHNVQSQAQAEEPVHSIFTEAFEHTFDNGDPSACLGGSGRSRRTTSTPSTNSRCRGSSNGVRGDRQPGRFLRLASDSMSEGHKKHLLGKIKKSRPATHRRSRKWVDILETFAGNALISKTAARYGANLSTVEGQAQCSRIRNALRPLCLIQGIHCTPWLIMQENMNYIDRPEVLEQIRQEERPTLAQAIKWCCDQHDDGNYYLIENPKPSRFWSKDDVVNMLEYTHGMIVTCHSGAYGATNSKGEMIKKTFQFASNDPIILEYLTKKLNPEQLAQCVPLEGKEVTLSQHYPPGLVQAILQGVKKVARLKNPCRFQVQHVFVNFSMPMDDQEKWNNIMDLASRFKAPVEVGIFWYGYPNEIDEDQGIPAEEAMLRDEVPMDQHGNLQLQPRSSHDPKTGETFHDEITFPGASGIDRSIKLSVSRMHKNLGHLPGPEMLKLLAMNGITSDQVIKCIKAMTCAACSRARPPLRPNPAAAPHHVGQFADNLQANIFYLRDITCRNHPVLGVICEATHLHGAMRLTSRSPAEVFEALRLCWLQNFGYPLKLAVDDDGAFKAEFDEKMNAGGTYLDVIPGEAHYKLGVIERHNGTLRMLLERIVDSTPCASETQPHGHPAVPI
eukprot:Skav226340  [mRNA]  locus=scaffold3640:78828:81310:- [translate_table: standard]